MKKFCFLFISCLFLVLFSGCRTNSQKRINIVTSFYPMYIIALNLLDGVDDVGVSNMTENHVGCLHDFQLQSDDMKKIENADAFIINGAGMESFLDKITEAYPDMYVIDSSKDVELIKGDRLHENENEESDNEQDKNVNPHIWVSINNYMKQVTNVYDGLKLLDPKNQPRYFKNMMSYMEKLEILKNKMHAELDDLPNRNIITFHEAFPYFAEEFQLNILAVMNIEPESEPSVKQLADITKIVKENKVKSLFVEPQYPDTSAQTIANETGAKVYMLDPASSGEVSKDAYINVMEKNLQVLKEALG